MFERKWCQFQLFFMISMFFVNDCNLFIFLDFEEIFYFYDFFRVFNIFFMFFHFF